MWYIYSTSKSLIENTTHIKTISKTRARKTIWHQNNKQSQGIFEKKKNPTKKQYGYPSFHHRWKRRYNDWINCFWRSLLTLVCTCIDFCLRKVMTIDFLKFNDIQYISFITQFPRPRRFSILGQEKKNYFVSGHDIFFYSIRQAGFFFIIRWKSNVNKSPQRYLVVSKYSIFIDMDMKDKDFWKSNIHVHFYCFNETFWFISYFPFRLIFILSNLNDPHGDQKQR